MMVDLNYAQALHVYHRILGPPSMGDDRWQCPFCESDCSVPPFQVKQRPSGKTKYRCFACDVWGDVHDLLRARYPQRDYVWRLDEIHRLLEDFEGHDDAGFSLDGMGWEDPEETRERKIALQGIRDADYPHFLGFVFGLEPQDIIDGRY